MNTKPWFLSVTIISSIVGGLAQIAQLFHVNIADLTPAITDAIGQQINATIAIAGAVGAIYGRIRATTQIHPSLLGRTSPSVNLLPFALAFGLGVGCVLMTGCAATSIPTSTAGVPAATTTTTAVSPVTLALIQTGATVATGAVLDFAVTQPSTRTQLANEIYSSANALYQASGGTPLTPTALNALLVSWGINGGAQYTQYVTAVDALYTTYYNKYVTSGSTSTQNFAAIVKALAAGAESGASAYATVTVPPPASVPAVVPASGPASTTLLLDGRWMRIEETLVVA